MQPAFAWPYRIIGGILILMAELLSTADAGERQLTSTPRNHALDNNDNYSKDDRFLCFDTRGTHVSGNGSSASIMKVDVRTGEESTIYSPSPAIQHPVNAAPGVIAASYNPVADEVVFIHGPLVSETAKLGFYGKTNRRGAVADANGSGSVRFLDYRDVDSPATPPGAHRGGTHRHEYSLDGKRIGFTYDDHLLTAYGRTVGMLVPDAKAPGGVSHWFTVLVPVVPESDARPGDLVSAAYDAWIGPSGLMRAFIGRVKEADGSLRNSLFVVDVPADVDVRTAGSGTRETFPAPPRGVRIRRLTHQDAKGIVRGSKDGTRIAYFAKAADGTTQVFLIGVHGSDRDPDPAMRPVQATHFEGGVQAGVRWHPSGNSIAVLTDHGVAITCVKPGKLFGQSRFLTAHGPKLPAAEALVWSNSGAQLAFNRRTPAVDGTKDADGLDFQQVFVVSFPDADGDGIFDGLQ